MIVLDANLLVYAYDASSSRHERARSWLEEALGGDEAVGFPLISLLAFVRVCTNPNLFEDPLTVAEAVGIVPSWLAQPSAGVTEPTDRHWDVLESICAAGQARGPLIMNAHLAALAMEHGATLCTTDRDFARFPGLRFADPLSPSD